MYRPNLNDPESVRKIASEARIERISATPSFLRRLLLHVDPQPLGKYLSQITIGGEVVDQALLDALHASFPAARITHVYASTEMGSCFAVNDGQAGFPISYISNSGGACELRVSEIGELEIRSRRAMLGYLDNGPKRGAESSRSLQERGWFQTGDLVEQRGDRYYFVG